MRSFLMRGSAFGLHPLCATLGLLLTLGASSAVSAQETGGKVHRTAGYRAWLEKKDALYIATYQTPQGKIRASLPADLRKGDVILVTTRLEPKGRSDEERAANREKLAALQLALAGERQPVQEPQSLRWTLPTDMVREAAMLTLQNADNDAVAQVDLPLPAPLPPAVGSNPRDGVSSLPNTSSGPMPNASQFPLRGRAGKPLALPVPPGAEAQTLEVLIGGKAAPLLAASPRAIIVESPKDVLGKTTLQLKNGNDLLADVVFRNDRAVRRTNPWPYVIGGVVITGVVTAIVIDNAINDIGHHIFKGNIGLPGF